MLFCLLALLCACKGEKEDWQTLESIERAWQLCETSLPDAQAYAERLEDSVRVASEYVRRKYDLLTIRLRDKCDIIPSSPDSAAQAVAYFASRDNDEDKERAYYYLGSAYRDLRDYPRAVGCFLKAVGFAGQGGDADTLVWQNALSQLRFLYMIQLNYEEELDVALQSVALAKASPIPQKGGVRRNLGAYLMDVASAYEHLNDTLRCLLYCDSSRQVIQQEHFPPKYGRILASMLATYSKYNHQEEVGTLLRHLSQLPEDQRPGNYRLCLAMFHERAGSTDSAIVHYKAYYGKEKTLTGRYEATAGLQRCYLRKRDFRRAAEWGCRLYDTNDTIIGQRAFEETQRARDTYIYYRDREKERAIVQRDEHIIYSTVIAGLALLSIVSGWVAFYSNRRKKFMEEIVGKEKMLGAVRKEMRKRQEELETKKREIASLGGQLEEADQTIATSKKQLEDALKELEQRMMINRELTRIALMNNAADKAENVIAHFRDIASGHAILDDGDWKELMAAIETLHPGFQEKVQGRLKRQLHEPLLRTICLLKVGMKPMQIAKVMDKTIQTVWNRVKRAEETCGDLLSSS